MLYNIPNKVINLYISYLLTPWFRNLDTDFTLSNCLFGSVKLTKNADPDKYKYSRYSIRFDSRSELLFKNVSSSVHVDNKNKDILILVEGPTKV